MLKLTGQPDGRRRRRASFDIGAIFTQAPLRPARTRSKSDVCDHHRTEAAEQTSTRTAKAPNNAMPAQIVKNSRGVHLMSPKEHASVSSTASSVTNLLPFAARCSLPSCRRHTPYRCAGCGLAFYCCRAHQLQHWHVHQLECAPHTLGNDGGDQRCMPCKPTPAWQRPSKPDPLPQDQVMPPRVATLTSETITDPPDINEPIAQSSSTMSAQEFRAALKAGRVWFNSDGKETWKTMGATDDANGASDVKAAVQNASSREIKVLDDVGADASRAARTAAAGAAAAAVTAAAAETVVVSTGAKTSLEQAPATGGSAVGAVRVLHMHSSPPDVDNGAISPRSTGAEQCGAAPELTIEPLAEAPSVASVATNPSCTATAKPAAVSASVGTSCASLSRAMQDEAASLSDMLQCELAQARAAIMRFQHLASGTRMDHAANWILTGMTDARLPSGSEVGDTAEADDSNSRQAYEMEVLPHSGEKSEPLSPPVPASSATGCGLTPPAKLHAAPEHSTPPAVVISDATGATSAKTSTGLLASIREDAHEFGAVTEHRTPPSTPPRQHTGANSATGGRRRRRTAAAEEMSNQFHQQSHGKRVKFGSAVDIADSQPRRHPQHEQNVEQLLEMGVVASRKEAETALKHNQGDPERSVNWLLNGGLLELQRRAAADKCSPSTQTRTNTRYDVGYSADGDSDQENDHSGSIAQRKVHPVDGANVSGDAGAQDIGKLVQKKNHFEKIGSLTKAAEYQRRIEALSAASEAASVESRARADGFETAQHAREHKSLLARRPGARAPPMLAVDGGGGAAGVVASCGNGVEHGSSARAVDAGTDVEQAEQRQWICPQCTFVNTVRIDIVHAEVSKQ